MNVIISPKDTTNKIPLADVRCYFQEGNCFTIVFNNGETRMYPLMHIWYVSVVPT
jgi:hypothetical protein